MKFMYDEEIAFHKTAQKYGFVPKIQKIEGQKVYMDHLGESNTLSDIYGDNPEDIPSHLWVQIRTMVQLLLDKENIEYVDVTPYNFIETNGTLYMIDFGDAKYAEKEINWYLKEFLEGENFWNPDFR